MSVARFENRSRFEKREKKERKERRKREKHATRRSVAHNCIAMVVISISPFWVTRLKHDVVEYLIDPRGRVSRGGFDVRR